MDNAFSLFPNLDENQKQKLLHFANLLKDINEKINLISRKDMDEVFYRHVLFCLAITQFLKPSKGSLIADVGTGGGLPGIVMAIAYPESHIYMYDGVGKKITAIQSMIDELGLKNAFPRNARIESQKLRFNYITGRSVAALPQFFNFVKKSFSLRKSGNLPCGVVYFKGGELEPELLEKKILPTAELDLQKFFSNDLYANKKILHFNAEDVQRI